MKRKTKHSTRSTRVIEIVRDYFSTREAAQAIGASESSIKRWCDRGLVATEKTRGGHRRIPAADLVGCIRGLRIHVADATILGLPSGTGDGAETSDRSVEALTRGLIEGDEAACRRVVFDRFLSGERLSEVGDRLIAQTFCRIGQLWEQGDAEVYQERRATEIMRRILSEIRGVLPAASAEAPLALGATPLGDHFCLPTSLVEIVLREIGWNAESLGISLPFVAMETAVRRYRPALFWISASYVGDPESFIEQYETFFDAHSPDVAVVVGGRALSGSMRDRLRYTAFCDRLEHLESFASTLAGSVR
jgi:MerR family transcriptional regulator, light-induced transcriptional regulator